MRAALSSAEESLERRQLPYGEFPSYKFSTAALDGPGTLDSSPFVTTFVVYALAMTEAPAAPLMMKKGLQFLLSEQRVPGVWRYWTSRNGAPIDPDLDDTACVSFLLRMLAPELAPDNRVLFSRFRTPEGLYKTWFRKPGARNDVDSVVNANVLLYLGETEETRAASDWLCRIINEDTEAGTYWYYLEPLSLYYAVSRAYHHGATGLERCREAVLRKTLARQQPDGSFGSALSSGLALCTLLNYGVKDTEAVTRGTAFLLRAQQEDGSWAREAFYIGPEPPGPHQVWWGSEELTTAFCVEALAKGLRAGM
ncbi:prenyltransferase/squalene oxidase repeat-containing protein [Corallococcus exercitus]|uniref:prenyltransferase/squalene oxidase repeat-containing protein n=1 Tax=Corallococcus exercitus TaxID=2316736 RepID=UPI0013158786|nr:prenyltransferase/squalene oxidase repeat-containing protein [Corallococcus exercitus]